MKPVNRDWLKVQFQIIDRLKQEGLCKDLPLRVKYHCTATFKFGGKKRTNSNSGGCGRAGRRKKRHGGMVH